MLAAYNQLPSALRETRAAARRRMFEASERAQSQYHTLLCNLCAQPVIDALLDIGAPLRDVLALTSIAKGASISDDGRGVVEQRRSIVIGTHATVHIRDQRRVEMLERMRRQGTSPSIAEMHISSRWDDYALQWRYVESIPAGVNALHVHVAAKHVAKMNRVLSTRQVAQAIRRIEFSNSFDLPMAGVYLPPAVTHLVFGWDFGCDTSNVLADFEFPATLQSLEFGACFDQSLDDVRFPSTLTHLTFGTLKNGTRISNFRHSLDRVTFPSSLTHLEFGNLFNRYLFARVWPS